MKYLIFLLFVMLFSCQPSEKVEEQEIKYSGNPLFEGWYADPEVIVYDDTFWIYPNETHPNHRETCIDRMEFDQNGEILPVMMTD